VVIEAHVDAFITASRANSCTVHGPVRGDERDVAAFVAGVVASVVVDRGAPVALAAGDPVLAALPLRDSLTATGCDVIDAAALDWRERFAVAGAGVTGARIGVAEQGVFAVECGPGAPRSTSLLPPRHVCVLPCSVVVPTFADAIEQLASEPLPSALTWIGGPSRTSDLEMVQTLGVHGPKSVDVVLVAFSRRE
jgi:L-lactate dehydrogenase complex protein LldG